MSLVPVCRPSLLHSVSPWRTSTTCCLAKGDLFGLEIQTRDAAVDANVESVGRAAVAAALFVEVPDAAGALAVDRDAADSSAEAHAPLCAGRDSQRHIARSAADVDSDGAFRRAQAAVDCAGTAAGLEPRQLQRQV